MLMFNNAVQMLWKTATEDGLMSAFGMAIAVFAVVFWCVEFYGGSRKGTPTPSVNRLIYPLILLVLLFSGGSNLFGWSAVVEDFTMSSVNQGVSAEFQAQ